MTFADFCQWLGINKKFQTDFQEYENHKTLSWNSNLGLTLISIKEMIFRQENKSLNDFKVSLAILCCVRVIKGSDEFELWWHKMFQVYIGVRF